MREGRGMIRARVESPLYINVLIEKSHTKKLTQKAKGNISHSFLIEFFR